MMKFINDTVYGIALGIGLHIGWGIVGLIFDTLSKAVK